MTGQVWIRNALSYEKTVFEKLAEQVAAYHLESLDEYVIKFEAGGEYSIPSIERSTMIYDVELRYERMTIAGHKSSVFQKTREGVLCTLPPQINDERCIDEIFRIARHRKPRNGDLRNHSSPHDARPELSLAVRKGHGEDQTKFYGFWFEIGEDPTNFVATALRDYCKSAIDLPEDFGHDDEIDLDHQPLLLQFVRNNINRTPYCFRNLTPEEHLVACLTSNFISWYHAGCFKEQRD